MHERQRIRARKTERGMRDWKETGKGERKNITNACGQTDRVKCKYRERERRGGKVKQRCKPLATFQTTSSPTLQY